ncbi:helix-turn-helix transcriptional regulator [Serratia sp. 14-2641]|uniref:helix-turn-helix domain-containing protein n=1 Tax=Serratia sp. 14-2641 TaxID=1841657 RepID=UPI00080F80EF|nr:helix-turn-helix transcriptional regulator [Serratia sp. 14-2641]OCJ27758.1 transcriptional regulator [Serratia sp. 14-2641]
MSVGEKIRAIRESEGLTRDEFGALLDIPIGTLKRYETNRIGSIGGEVLMKIAQHPRFTKYTMWLMTGGIAPEIGQISPDLSPDGPSNTSDHREGRKVG